jgi:hypothetical protein
MALDFITTLSRSINYWSKGMTFGEWIELSRDLGMDEAEIDAAIGVHARLKVAAIIAADVLATPSEQAVLTVFTEVNAGTSNAVSSGLRTLH